ncbi:hypothetical protein [Nonlabens xiamenensis]|uniref:hypothetical protein n=1 Tax=Nonlabens xiamenensis TaxID=2341043 RepID=UPI000F609546|nr:hypothetical protein [Nonlabens xiamenensis]
MAYSTQPKAWFWILAIIFLLWNLIGLGALTRELFAPEQLTEMMNEEELELYNARPSWYIINYAIAVLSGLFACLALLFKRKLAVILSLISLFTVLISTGYNLSTGTWEIVSLSEKVFFVLIPVMAILLWLFCRSVNQKGWLK